jgi:ketosteroid isomerase-like protein
MDAEKLALIERVADESAIREVVYRYCRGIDRRQFDLVRSCYHPDATDDHGAYKGGVDGFIEHCQAGLSRYERTMHFIGNLLIEVDGDQAKSEAYTIAYHRLSPREERPARDHIVAFRYLDRFERRGGQWRIRERICVFDWTRTDPVPKGWDFVPGFVRGMDSGADRAMKP